MSTTSIRGGAGRSRLRPLWLRTIAIAAALVVGITGTVVASNQPAWADEYASWADVNAARTDVAKAEALIKTIESQLAALKANAEATAQDAADKSSIWMEADQKFQAAASRADTLQAQADEANALAVVSQRRAGQMAAQMMRSGSEDVTTNLLLNAGDADDLLYGLGMSGKITVQADAVFARAIFDQNTAQAQTDAADVAKTELEALKVAAEAAYVEAQAASLAAAAALEEQLNRQNELNQQLVVLRERRTATEADYMAGVRARYALASIEAGEISDSGWVQPARGYISSTYGGRDLRGSYNFHTGTDIANSCGTNIFAASSGTVTISAGGWNGGYGQYIAIDHGNGISTRYGHILDGGRLVSAGEHVDVGQNIAKIGSTGNSTGCHLHFEVLTNGRSQDAQPFMRAQGVPLG